MDKHMPNMLVSLFRGARVAVHLVFGVGLAIVYPHLNRTKQNQILKKWCRQLLTIFNIGIQIEGQQITRGEGGCLMVANHVSWLDIFVLNSINPSQFIAKSEVRSWPIIGWLCSRSDTIFIDRGACQSTSKMTQHIRTLLAQGSCIGLFPEGTTTNGKQVGHFHSSLIQPAIDANARLYPVALRYQDEKGELSIAAAFIGDTTLMQSIWNILRCSNLNALVVFNPTLQVTNENRRVLTRAARDAIAQSLQNIGMTQQINEQQTERHFPHNLLSSQSTYKLLVDPLITHRSE